MSKIRFDDTVFPSRISMIDEKGFEEKSKEINSSAIDIAKDKLQQSILKQNTFRSFKENEFMKKAFELFEPTIIEIEEK